MVEDFCTRPLDSGPYYYLSCDAMTMKVREGGRAVTTSVLLATGVHPKGVRSECVAQIVGRTDEYRRR